MINESTAPSSVLGFAAIVAALPHPGRGRLGSSRPGLCHSWSNQSQPERIAYLHLVGKNTSGART